MAGASDIAVINRTGERARAVASLAGKAGRAVDALTLSDLERADLVVNATPIGMAGVAPLAEESAPAWVLDPAATHPGQVVADLIYAPRPTAWLREAAKTGATTVDGLGMLVHQAAAQIELWTGLEAPLDAMWKAANVARPGADPA